MSMKTKKKTLYSGRKSFKYRGSKCLNCDHPLDKSDRYCPRCSQINSDKHLSASDFFAEFIGSIIVYDSRLRNTVRDILFHPGKMTENYIKGQRMKYANPFRFFLSVSIIYILFQSVVDYILPSDKSQEERSLNLTPANNDSLVKYFEAEQEKYPEDKQMKSVNKYFAAKKLTDSLARVEKDTSLSGYYNFRNSPLYYTETSLENIGGFGSFSKRMTLYWEFYNRNKIMDSKDALDSLNHRNSMANRWNYSRVIAAGRIADDPKAFSEYIKVKVPFFLFFFSPIFALFFKLFYPKRFNYMDHLIFIFHIFSFVFLAMLILEIPDLILDTNFFDILIFALLGPLYFYKALRRFYKQSRIMSFMKFGLLSIVFGFCFIVSATIFLALSAALY